MAINPDRPFSEITEYRLKSEPGFQLSQLNLLEYNNPGIRHILESAAPSPAQKKLCIQWLARRETILLLQQEIQRRPSRYVREEDYPLDNHLFPHPAEWVQSVMQELEQLPQFFAEKMSAYQGRKEKINRGGELVMTEDLGEILSWNFHELVEDVVQSYVQRLSGSTSATIAEHTGQPRLSGVVPVKDSTIIARSAQDDTITASELRAKDVATIRDELHTLKTEIYERSQYEISRQKHPEYLTFKAADKNNNLELQVRQLAGYRPPMILVYRLVAALHNKEVSTVQKDWKTHKPRTNRKTSSAKPRKSKTK